MDFSELPKLIKGPGVFSVRNYLQQCLKLETAPARVSQMVLCGLATCFPLLIGLWRGDPTAGIYGALMGYFLTLNDHFGPIRHRLIVITLTFLMLLGGASLGVMISGSPSMYLVCVSVLAYWIGLMGGEGAELERAILFATIEVIVGYHSTSMSLDEAPMILGYALLGYVLVVGAAIFHWALSKKPTNTFARLSDSLRGPLASKPQRHWHAFSYMVVAIVSILLVEHYKMERGYWSVITALLVMKPDRRQSLNRSFQRFFGTGLGVFVSEPIIYFFRTPLPIMLIISLGTALVPWASKKNYWLMSMVTSVVVVLLLDLAVVERGDFHAPILRLEATMIGCCLGGFGVWISKMISLGMSKWHRRREQDSGA